MIEDPKVALLRRIYAHMTWADARLAEALVKQGTPADAIREYAHVAGAEEVWLSRMERRPPEAAVWPEISAADAVKLTAKTCAGFERVIGQLNDAMLEAPVKYTNSAGKTFATPLGDILIHVAMHGQYHRGKVNYILRQTGIEPVPVDFIGFVRGVPAATQATSR